MSVFLAILLSILLMSFIEHWVHRFVMHRQFLWLRSVYYRHWIEHHRTYYKVFNNEPDEHGKYVNLRFNILVSLLIMMPIVIPIYYYAWRDFAIYFPIVVVLHHILWNIIHVEMHVPKHRWFSKFKIYRWLAQYHWLHHKYTGMNYNVVFPLADYILGRHINARPHDIEEMNKIGL